MRHSLAARRRARLADQAVDRRDGAHHEGFGAADLVHQNCEQLARLRGAAFTLLLITTALVGSTLLLPPAILLPLGLKKLYTKYASSIAWWWFSSAAAARASALRAWRHRMVPDVRVLHHKMDIFLCKGHPKS